MADTIQDGAPLRGRYLEKRKPLRAGSDLPEEVRGRLDELFSREALEDALEGVQPDRITKVRKDRWVASRACYLALGVTCEGGREPLPAVGRGPHRVVDVLVISL